MTAADVIAQTSLLCTSSAGKQIPLTIEIGRPRSVHGCAACTVHIRGPYQEMTDIHGVDTFQALALASSFVRLSLESLVRQGYRVTMKADDAHDFDFEDAWFLATTTRADSRLTVS
jgi:hypothetical protein